MNLRQNFLKKKIYILSSLFLNSAYAESMFRQYEIKKARTLSDLADNVVAQIDSIATLMIALSYVSGVGFAISAIYKFKQHKDNPTQVPVTNAFAILAVSVLLVFLPGLFKPAARSVFGVTKFEMVHYTSSRGSETY